MGSEMCIRDRTIPAFAVKMDAVPGRINDTWFKVNNEGVYYGQCSELCGPRHAFMPINVKVVSQEEFDEWIEYAKVEYASIDKKQIKLAAR